MTAATRIATLAVIATITALLAPSGQAIGVDLPLLPALDLGAKLGGTSIGVDTRPRDLPPVEPADGGGPLTVQAAEASPPPAQSQADDAATADTFDRSAIDPTPAPSTLPTALEALMVVGFIVAVMVALLLLAALIGHIARRHAQKREGAA